MKTFKRAFTKKTMPIVEQLKTRDNLRHIDAILIDKIRRDGVTLHRLYECACNGCTREKFSHESWEAYDKARVLQQEWIDQRIEKLESRIKKNAELAGLNLYLQTDPRGWTVLSRERKTRFTELSQRRDRPTCKINFNI